MRSYMPLICIIKNDKFRDAQFKQDDDMNRKSMKFSQEECTARIEETELSSMEKITTSDSKATTEVENYVMGSFTICALDTVL
jgi:hypothetical protein